MKIQNILIISLLFTAGISSAYPYRLIIENNSKYEIIAYLETEGSINYRIGIPAHGSKDQSSSSPFTSARYWNEALSSGKKIATFTWKDSHTITLRYDGVEWDIIQHPSTLRGWGTNVYNFASHKLLTMQQWSGDLWWKVRRFYRRKFQGEKTVTGQKKLSDPRKFPTQRTKKFFEPFTVQIVNATDTPIFYGREALWHFPALAPRDTMTPTINLRNRLSFNPQASSTVSYLDIRKFQKEASANTGKKLVIIIKQIFPDGNLGFYGPMWLQRRRVESDQDHAWRYFPAANTLRFFFISSKGNEGAWKLTDQEEQEIARLVLNVPANTSAQEVAKKFRTLSERYHSNKEAYLTENEKKIPIPVRREIFKIFSEAFSALSQKEVGQEL